MDVVVFVDKESSRMKKALTPLTVLFVILTGYSLNWLKGSQPSTAPTRLTAQEICATEAAVRHRTCQPQHWRSMVMQPH